MASRTNVNANKCAGSGGDECEKEEMVEVHVLVGVWTRRD